MYLVIKHGKSCDIHVYTKADSYIVPSSSCTVGGMHRSPRNEELTFVVKLITKIPVTSFDL
jgi:hypothetical protein